MVTPTIPEPQDARQKTSAVRQVNDRERDGKEREETPLRFARGRDCCPQTSNGIRDYRGNQQPAASPEPRASSPEVSPCQLIA